MAEEEGMAGVKGRERAAQRYGEGEEGMEGTYEGEERDEGRIGIGIRRGGGEERRNEQGEG